MAWHTLPRPVVEVKDAPLWWHLKGLQQTSSGYGRKLTTTRMVRLEGDTVWRRIYVTQFSNAGTAWIMVQGKPCVIHDFDLPTE